MIFADQKPLDQLGAGQRRDQHRDEKGDRNGIGDPKRLHDTDRPDQQARGLGLRIFHHQMMRMISKNGK
jgi:hypothetical protein